MKFEPAKERYRSAQLCFGRVPHPFPRTGVGLRLPLGRAQGRVGRSDTGETRTRLSRNRNGAYEFYGNSIRFGNSGQSRDFPFLLDRRALALIMVEQSGIDDGVIGPG